jgi:anti-sigma B factor antagonist
MAYQDIETDDRAWVRDGLLAVATWLDRGRAMAELCGELDVYSARFLSEKLMAVQHQAPRPVLVLVLENLEFADSSGLGVMVGALKRARAKGGAVALCSTPANLRRVLEITGLDRVLPSFDSLEASWAWLDEGYR